jgi:hypothetical protein
MGAGAHFQPFTEYPMHMFDEGFYRRGFMKRMLAYADAYGFERISSEVIDPDFFQKTLSEENKFKYRNASEIPEELHPTLHVFRNPFTEQTVHYYTSTPILFEKRRWQSQV